MPGGRQAADPSPRGSGLPPPGAFFAAVALVAVAFVTDFFVACFVAADFFVACRAVDLVPAAGSFFARTAFVAGDFFLATAFAAPVPSPERAGDAAMPGRTPRMGASTWPV